METDSTLINSIGLFADIIGAMLLFKYGLPEVMSKTGYSYLLVKISDKDIEENKKKADKYNLWGKVGLILLIVGFIFQLVSNFITK